MADLTSYVQPGGDYGFGGERPWRPRVQGPANFSQLLLGSLCDLLAQTFEHYPLPTPKGEQAVKAPMVFLHGMPDDGGEALYPFFLVRWIERTIQSDQDHKTTLTDDVGIVVGINAPWSQEQAGWLLADTIDVACSAIWRKRILADRFELVEPVRAAIPGAEQKVHLYHMATLTTRWTCNWPPKGLPEMTANGVLQ